MRFLADESCDFAVVRALRADGHDVLAVAECSPGLDDALVMDLALREQRILLTEDKDFGQLVYSKRAAVWRSHIDSISRQRAFNLAIRSCQLCEIATVRLAGRFVVVSPGRSRVRSF